ncbi:MAG: FG-GAP repeat protein [Acidobacteriota bacterium]
MLHRRSALIPIFALLVTTVASAQSDPVIDLLDVAPEDGIVRRVYGATGQGTFGVPVAGGFDVDGDGLVDYAVAYMLARSFGFSRSGEVDLIFGDGTTGGFVDTALDDPNVLRLGGSQIQENAGSEIWMDDVTGDGLGDLLISRQNFSPTGRIGAGALTLVVGGAALRAQAETLELVDLSAPPPAITLTTLVGANALDRLGIWARTGDVTGDGIADIVVGADQEDLGDEENRGAVYVLRGGPHLATGGVFDLAQPTLGDLEGHVTRITPPPGADGYHFGATCQIADLDGNGRGEVLMAAALNRAGALLQAFGAPAGSAEPTGGAPDGTLYIAWDDNFPADLWPAGYSFEIQASPGSRTIINGEFVNITFGEEILGGLDLDVDGVADLFIGDLVADGTDAQDRSSSGLGHVFFNAADLKDRAFDLDAPPPGLTITRILGPSQGAIGGDTAAAGDFDGDGYDDLAFTSPHANPQGRTDAGAVHVFFGRPGSWPATIDLAEGALPPASTLRIAEIQGGRGFTSGDVGDTLGYSAAAGDINGDGLTDLITNEMVGNGLSPGTVDVGNLIVVSGQALAPVDPPPTCEPSPTALCLSDDRFRVEARWQDFAGATGDGIGAELTGDTGTFWFFSPDNIELVVKVLDACIDPFQRFWVFAGGLTDVAVDLTVTDTLTGESRLYTNSLGTAFQPVRDTAAFDTCTAGGATGSGAWGTGGSATARSPFSEAAQLAPLLQATDAPGSCEPTAETLCLNDGRFAVEVLWETPIGETGAGQAMNLTADTGTFWFFSPDNIEVVIKVLDACSLPGFENFWVFGAGLTDVRVELRVTDTVSGEVQQYINPQGAGFQPIRETGVFQTCP